MVSTVAEFPLTGLGAGKASTVPLEGRLEGTSVPEILCALSRESFSGALMLERRSVRKVLYLREGRVVFAASSDPEDRLGTFLLRRGEVRLAPMLEASGQVARGRRLGQILVDSGVMDPGAVVRAVLDQVREVALSVFVFREGSYKLSRVSLPANESITLDLPMETLVLTGVKRMRDWRWVRRAVGGPRAVYRRADASDVSPASLGMTERAILEQLQRPCRVDLLCREVYAPSYDIYRSLWGLAIIGAIQREDPRMITGIITSATEGFLPQRGAIELLLDLGARRFSGVLRLFQAGLEGALFLQAGRVQFATTNDSEKSLVTHLLRRGVISDRDHDDAVRRLLSGKRIGTILAERGALQPDDVERFVREQLMDVARSLAQWQDGEYTLEEHVALTENVTLDASVEEVVVEACTAQDTFDRLWEELGGLGTLFRLRRDYLDRLDRMTLRPTIWELVSLLGQERTVEELLTSRPEPDFELVRLIYALERVGVIEKVGEAEILARVRDKSRADTFGSSSSLLTPTEPPLAEPMAQESLQASDNALDLAPELFSREQREQASPSIDTVVANASAAWFSQAIPAEESANQKIPHDAAPAPLGASAEENPLEGLPASAESQPPIGTESLEETFVEAPATDYGSEEVDVAAVAEVDLGSTLETERPAFDPSRTLEIPRALLDAALDRPAEAPNHSFDTPQLHDTPSLGLGAPVQERDPAPAAEPAESDLATGEAPRSPGLPADGDAAADAGTHFELDTPAIALPPIEEAVYIAVDRFNRRHGLVFQEIRSEIGAGARNFVLTCVRRLGPYGVAFEGLEPDRAGAFDREGLARGVVDRSGGNANEALDGLIDLELSLVGDLLSPSRRAMLHRMLHDA